MMAGSREAAGAERLWAEYKRTGDRAARDKLVVLYAPLVKYVAARVGVGLPRHVDQADLVSYGIIGLIDAIDRFEPGRHVKFETYAIPRIKGAIIDELRALDWVPRSVRSKARRFEQAYATLEATLKRPPTDAEVAEALDLSEDDLRDVLQQISFVGVAALDEVFTGSDRAERATLGDTLADDTSSGPVASLEDKESREQLARAIAELSERERTVLALYYYEGLTLAEIGEVIGVTESRVCQIHAKAVFQLRARLGARERVSGDGRGARGARPRARRSGEPMTAAR
jgi:RNA polymerase sigma factor for flagellar operon FliA